MHIIRIYLVENYSFFFLNISIGKNIGIRKMIIIIENLLLMLFYIFRLIRTQNISYKLKHFWQNVIFFF